MGVGGSAWLAAAALMILPQNGSAGLVLDRNAASLIVTVDEGTSVAEAMRTLGDLCDFSVVVRGDTAPLGPLRFRAHSVVEAVRRIARGHQLVIRHAADAQGRSVVQSVALMPKGTGTAAVSPAPVGTRPTSSRHAPDPEVLDRLVEVAGMGDRPAGEALPALAQVVESDPKPEARAAAIRALSRIAKPDAMVYIDKALGDQDPKVRTAALHAQPPHREDFPYSTVEEMAFSDPDSHVRQLARTLLDDHYQD